VKQLVREQRLELRRLMPQPRGGQDDGVRASVSGITLFLAGRADQQNLLGKRQAKRLELRPQPGDDLLDFRSFVRRPFRHLFADEFPPVLLGHGVIGLQT
jgi:hypothetical protein